MAYVIAEPCAGCKDQSCVAVCPVDCIREGRLEQEGVVYDQLFIQPDVCICCGLCESECPVDAIFMDDELPDPWRRYAQINAGFFHNLAAGVKEKP